jgi:hypothetical protein
MTFFSDHLQCDNCNAVTPVASDTGWEALVGDGPSAHLCPKCVGLRNRDELVMNPLGIRCARCGRTPIDGVEKWWVARGEQGEALDVCDDCFDDDRDVYLPVRE